MPSFGFDGFNLAFEVRGRPRRGAQSRPFVLLHGLLFPRTHHIGLADALVERGNQVILLDLLGHGESDKPGHARHYTMELFGRQVLALLDHLDIPEAVVGGTSLGANVTLETAVAAPDRVKAMFIEMPVLERAAPAAALIFVPLTLMYSQLAGPLTLFAAGVRQMRPLPVPYGEVFRDLFSREPGPSAAVLHGLLTGRIAPHTSDREKIEQRTLIMGHGADLLHPLSDAEALARELRNAELIRSTSFFELRFPPNRLSDRLADFLDEVWE